MELTQEYLKEVIEYRAGVLYWRVSLAHRINVGDATGSIGHSGYLETRINGKLYRNHRLIFFMYYGYWPRIVDHIDQNRLNNLIENLRAATDRESLCNRSSFKGASSKYLGVFFQSGK